MQLEHLFTAYKKSTYHDRQLFYLLLLEVKPWVQFFELRMCNPKYCILLPEVCRVTTL